MSGRVYQGDNEDLLADGNLAGRADYLLSSTEIMSEAKRQAELHWEYVEKTLQIHCIDQSELDLCAHHYKTAFIHGWKHGQEAMNGKSNRRCVDRGDGGVRGMAKYFMNELDYNDVYLAPDDAIEGNELEEGDTITLLRVEVTSCTTFKMVGGKLVAQSLSFPLGGLVEA